MSIEVMKQAIKAFEELKREVTRDGTVSENWDAYYGKEYDALEALRKAVEQAEKQEAHKEWVGLTDEEIALYDKRLSGSGVARDIEAKLKEKNGE